MKKIVLSLFAIITFVSCEHGPNQYPLRGDEFDALKNKITEKGTLFTTGKISDKGIRLTDSNDIFELTSDSSKIYRKNLASGEEIRYYRSAN